MARRNLELLVVAMLVTGTMGVVLFKYQAYARLREQNHALSQSLEQLDRLLDENQRLRALAADLRQDSPDRLGDELAKLRREAERLRVHQEEWQQLCKENRQLRAELGNTVRPLIPKEDWTYVGYGDPESAAQSISWAKKSGDPTAIMANIIPETLATCSEEDIAAYCNRVEQSTKKVPGFQILGQKKISDDEVEVIMNIHPDRPDIANLRLPLKLCGSEWKFDVHLHPLR
jgi:type II secretory pathway pseudopilin PulG